MYPKYGNLTTLWGSVLKPENQLKTLNKKFICI